MMMMTQDDVPQRTTWRRNVTMTMMTKKWDADEEVTHDAKRDDNAGRWHTMTSCNY